MWEYLMKAGACQLSTARASLPQRHHLCRNARIPLSWHEGRLDRALCYLGSMSKSLAAPPLQPSAPIPPASPEPLKGRGAGIDARLSAVFRRLTTFETGVHTRECVSFNELMQ